MNEKLIEKLRNGEIAVKNDGTLGELNKVLRYAFFKHDYCTGISSFYTGVKKDNWIGYGEINLPSYSVKEFLTKEFPEKWAISRNLPIEQNKIVTKWVNDRFNINFNDYQVKYYYLINEIENKVDWGNIIHQHYTEISFEQFKQHILMENKEIEYYKVLKNCWGIQGTSWAKGNKLYATNTESLPYFKEIGLLDNPEYFKPVYKEEKTLPKINGYEGEIEGDYIVYGSNCAKFHKNFFIELLKFNNLNSYFGTNQNRAIELIKLDSGVEITMEQVKQIVEYINSKS